MTELAPPWYEESSITHSYVAKTCPYTDDLLRTARMHAAEQFAVATNAFISLIDTQPLRLSGLDFSGDLAWQSLAGQLVNRYRKAHWDLINSGDGYRQRVGDAYDEYVAADIRTLRKPETAIQQRRRHINVVHSRVTEAIGEGIPTAVASYGVVTGVVALREPDIGTAKQVIFSRQLLPAAGEFSRTLARNSKLGDRRLLRAIAKPARIGIVDYNHLNYDPKHFDIIMITDTGKLALQTNADHRESKDTIEQFHGCPALMYGSVGAINRLLAQTVLKHELFERALGRKKAVHVSV